MIVELVVPSVGESITEVQIGVWLKTPGEFVQRDEPIVEVESEKATVEIFAPVSGKITEILKKEGETANVGDLIGYLEEVEVPAGEVRKEPTPVAASVAAPDDGAEAAEKRVMPAAQRLLAEKGLRADDVPATGPGGRLLKEDVLRHLETAPPSTPAGASPAPMGAREEEVIAMSPMRRRIAEQLVTAQQTAALLTTFNEVDMSAVKALRSRFKDTYQEQFGVRLGFMSFFVKAAIEALKLVPEVNAEVRGTDVVYKNYYDIGIAVGGPKGLVVPILRNAERMSFAEIEAAIGALAAKVRDKKITVDELRGGTFTISNGGIYGSMLSTPIVSPPQSGILGMHAINDRPVVLDGNVVIRPIMYVALTYDHRVVDGQGAVTFLKRIKECIEDPTRILLEI